MNKIICGNALDVFGEVAEADIPNKIIDGKRQQGRTCIVAPKREHSKKPNEMRQMIEKVSYAPMVELFARTKTPGWDVWGNEVESDIEF